MQMGHFRGTDEEDEKSGAMNKTNAIIQQIGNVIGQSGIMSPRIRKSTPRMHPELLLDPEDS